MRLDIRPLRGGETGATLSVDKRVDAPRLADLDLGKLTVAGTATKLESTLLFSGEVTAAVRLQCSRCLVSYDEPVTAPLSEEFSMKPSGGPNAINLGPGIRTALLLALPNRPLHDSECRGLCVTCGKDLNADPHEHAQNTEDSPFSVLKKLK